MHPFYSDTPHPYSQQNYGWNIPTQPTIEKYRNRINYGWQNMSLGGWSYSQLNCSSPTPHYGWGFQTDGGARYLPHQTAGPANPIEAPERQPLPAAFCKICGVDLVSHKNIEQHNNGKRHRRMLKLHEISEEQKTINRQERKQMPNSPVNLVVQPKTVQKSEGNGYLVEHVSPETNVDRHKDYPRKDIGETSKVPAKKAEGELRDNVVAEGHGSQQKIRETRGDKYEKKNKRMRRAIESSKPDVNAPSNCVESIVQIRAAFCKICGADLASHKNIEQHNNGRRHQRMLKLNEISEEQKTINRQEREQLPNSLVNLVVQPKTVQKSEGNGYLVEHVRPETNVDRHKNYRRKDRGETSKVPTEKAEGELRDNFAAEGCGSKQKIRETRGDKYEKKNKRIRRATESSKSDVNAPSNCVKSTAQVPTIAPPQRSTALQELSPAPAVGSSFESQIQLLVQPELEHQVSEAMPQYESQNPTDETNVQLPSSILVEFDAPADSSTNTELERQVSEATANYESQIPTDETNVQLPSSISVEFDAPADSSTNTELEHQVSEAIPQYESQNPTDETNVQSVEFDAPADSSTNTELEHLVSEATAHYEGQNPMDETNVQLPSSISVEVDAPADSSTNTEISNGSSKAEEKMHVLTTNIRTAPLSQVNVCLKCGDQGFRETLVFCDKCQIYALHRYCLDGPVIFVEDVTWFCEDCEPKVIETSLNDQSTCHPSGTTDPPNLEKDAIQARMEITNCTKQVEESKQQQQNIVAKTKVQSCDSHNSSHQQLSQCSNDCDRENKFKKVCQAVLKDTANSNEETMNVKNSQAATSDDLNFVELEDHVVAQPVIDPIWRGSFCLHDKSIGTVSGLLAHLSDLACSQVREEIRLLPEELSVDLLQRSAVWPNCFMKCGPNHDSIAVYFFPENRAERDFDKLVDDIIHSDLAMRTVLECAELLVFPSTLLPIKYRRFQAKYYLWGVFKAKRTSSNTTSNVVYGEDRPLNPVLTSPYPT